MYFRNTPDIKPHFIQGCSEKHAMAINTYLLQSWSSVRAPVPAPAPVRASTTGHWSVGQGVARRASRATLPAGVVLAHGLNARTAPNGASSFHSAPRRAVRVSEGVTGRRAVLTFGAAPERVDAVRGRTGSGSATPSTGVMPQP